MNKLAIVLGLCAYAGLPTYADDGKASSEPPKITYQEVQIPQNIPSIEVQKPQILQVHKEKKATGSKMTIHNNGDEDLVITQFTCEGFGYTELHNSHFVNGEREMYEIKKIVVPAHGKLALTPNRMHLMMFKPERDFDIGEYLTMELETNLGKIPVIAEIVPRRLK
ncbi:MAG: hypothetical protein CR962_00915 [Gammaproteobacteria bacterium]|nr:MAG: hypothetical protein CR962_00915 [Gammaproteobacteria bacterium]